MISKGSRFGVGSLIRGRALRGPQDDKWRPAPLYVMKWNVSYSNQNFNQFRLHNKPYTAIAALQALSQGEEGGLDYFFDAHYPALCYFANTVVKDQPAAEDIAEEAFLKLWQRHDLFPSPASVKNFLYRTVHNAAIDALRRKKTVLLVQKEVLYLAQKEEPSVQQAIIEAETLNHIYASLKVLPPKCRQVFSLFYVEGKSYEEIAKELNLSINNVRNHKARALALLRGELSGTLMLLLSIVTYLH